MAIDTQHKWISWEIILFTLKLGQCFFSFELNQRMGACKSITEIFTFDFFFLISKSFSTQALYFWKTQFNYFVIMCRGIEGE